MCEAKGGGWFHHFGHFFQTVCHAQVVEQQPHRRSEVVSPERRGGGGREGVSARVSSVLSTRTVCIGSRVMAASGGGAGVGEGGRLQLCWLVEVAGDGWDGAAQMGQVVEGTHDFKLFDNCLMHAILTAFEVSAGPPSSPTITRWRGGGFSPAPRKPSVSTDCTCFNPRKSW